MAQAAGSIRKDLDLEAAQVSPVFSAFTPGDMLFGISTRRLSDAIGPRGALVRVVLWWSPFAALTGGAAA
jgi:hypothetical protein